MKAGHHKSEVHNNERATAMTSSLGLRICFGAALALCLAANAPVAFALTQGRIDTFSSGSADGWVSAAIGPNTAHVVLNGGPGGLGDGYVCATALGGAPRSQLSVLNVTQWAGDYIQAGVTGFQMDCWNAGKSALVLRILISRVSPSGQATDVVVSKPITLPPRRGWVPVVVSIDMDDLRTLAGDARLALSGATEVEIVQGDVHVFNRDDPSSPLDGFNRTLGVDNFRAIDLPVPTQSTSWARVKSIYR